MKGISEVGWSSFNATMAVEESELMAQLLGPYPFSSEKDQDLSLGIQSLFWSDHVTHSCYGSQDANSSLCYWPQDNNGGTFSTSSFFAPSSDYQEYYMSEANVVPGPAINSNNHEEMVFHMVEGAMTVPCNSFGYLNEGTSSEDSAVNLSEQVIALDQKPQHKRKFSMDEVTKPTENENKFDIATDVSKKKAKVSSQVLKSTKIPKSKKILKRNASDEEEENNAAALTDQTSSSCCSEDYSNASQELNGGSTSSSSKGPAALNLNGKARASRGSATDPQSLYARKRRERISERLRILQNLVPNGTKVDVSTMLEEAVQYVKFLQLQIKLLSSDELWMYAPLAYNGMDIGFDLKISPPRQ